MNSIPYDDALLQDVLQKTKTIALVGASPKPERASHEVMQFLLAKGYDVTPVNPGLAGQKLLGKTVYASLSDIPHPVDMVDIFRNSDAVGPIVDEAIKRGDTCIWTQLEVIDHEAAARAKAAGLIMIMDRCPKIEYPRLNIANS
ncbi:MAG: CoA-binding protein [Parvibaculaceae bacterium]|nr:CoA-binding protein [Parvibaculaceae bacterium]